ncbi:MAG: arylesterase [Chthoniobacterales bacterium]|nr:arylesterase [Chthoniobacterales bacterium]
MMNRRASRKLARSSFAIVFFALCHTSPVCGGTILFLGDSLTAGFGLPPEEAFPALVEAKIRERHLPFAVFNAGLSGDTSAGGLGRLDWNLQRPIDVLVLELGANDGLRGLPVAAMKANLQAIIDQVKAKNTSVKIVIAGMQVPPNLGPEYAAAFRAVFADLAQTNNAALIPFLLEGVGGNGELNQHDQIHPTAAGHKIIAENVWRVLEPLLAKN